MFLLEQKLSLVIELHQKCCYYKNIIRNRVIFGGKSVPVYIIDSTCSTYPTAYNLSKKHDKHTEY